MTAGQGQRARDAAAEAAAAAVRNAAGQGNGRTTAGDTSETVCMDSAGERTAWGFANSTAMISTTCTKRMTPDGLVPKAMRPKQTGVKK